MDRKIKFRGKHIDTGEWLYGDLVHSADMKRTGILVNDADSYDECEVLTETVGQFTELKDNNGKEICEDDIVHANKHNYLVKFYNGMFYGSIEECHKGIYGGFPLWSLVDMGCEIVGNKFDNPYLLK